jgi:hypothetical protein
MPTTNAQDADTGMVPILNAATITGAAMAGSPKAEEAIVAIVAAQCNEAITI